MKTEEQVNAILNERLDRYYDENRRMQNGAINSLEDVRREIVDILIQYADEGTGTVDKRRIREVLSAIGVAETTYESILEDSVEEIVDRTIERATNTSVASLGALLVAGIVLSTSDKNFIKDTVLNRDISDGMSINDRFWRVSGGLIDAVRTDIRNGVLQGLPVTTIALSVSRTIRNGERNVRRIIMTEGYNVYRRTLGEMASKSGVVKAIRIHDNRGRHRNHESHNCYKYAEQDPYGWGKGVYRIEDYYIYYPHPNCTAHFEYVLIDETSIRERINVVN